MRSYWISVGSNSVTGVLMKRGRASCGDRGRDGNDAATNREHQGIPATTRHQEEAWEDFSPEPLRGVCLCLYLDFRLLGSRTVKAHISTARSHFICDFGMSALGNYDSKWRAVGFTLRAVGDGDKTLDYRWTVKPQRCWKVRQLMGRGCWFVLSDFSFSETRG